METKYMSKSQKEIMARLKHLIDKARKYDDMNRWILNGKDESQWTKNDKAILNRIMERHLETYKERFAKAKLGIVNTPITQARTIKGLENLGLISRLDSRFVQVLNY